MIRFCMSGTLALKGLKRGLHIQGNILSKSNRINCTSLYHGVIFYPEQSNFIEITLQHGCYHVNLLYILQS